MGSTTPEEPDSFSFYGAQQAVEQTRDVELHVDPARFIVPDFSEQERSNGFSTYGQGDLVTGRSLSKRVQVGRGDTLMGLLIKASVPANDATDAIAAMRAVYDPRSLRIGQDIKVSFDGLARLTGLEMEPDAERTITVARTGDGSYQATQTDKVLQRQVVAAQAVIRTSMIEAGAAAGVPMPIIIAAIRAFSYSVDFQRDVQPGDGFEILYERYVNDSGASARDGDILFAGLTLSGKPIELFRLEMGDGKIEFFQPDGTSIRKALLRTPVDGARITSAFGMRQHPILGYSKMHKGMDFAAPNGTPVYAAGDGIIEEVGAWGAYGNYMRLRHNGTVSTAYAHLSKFGQDMKKGKRVRQGDVIAFVGTTGRSTGPHLHYEVIKGAEQVNPMSVELPLSHALEGIQLAIFKDMVEQRRREFQDARSNLLVASAPRGRPPADCGGMLVC